MENKTSKSPKEESCYRLIPEKELKCVWMTAGLLSYKLCKYDFRCEKCPLDWELRNVSTPSYDSIAPQEEKKTTSTKIGINAPWERDKQKEEVLKEDPSILNVKDSLYYHPMHTWIKVENVDEVRVGIDYFLGRMIGEVTTIILPLPGRQGLQGEDLCSIIQEGGSLNVVFPVSGLVLSVNHKLKEKPELLGSDPLGDGFLLTLKPENLRQDQMSLYYGEEALSWYRKEWERFKTAVISELFHGQKPYRSAPIRVKMSKAAIISDLYHGRGSPGMTMQDGEINLSDIKKMIDSKRYIRLISTFLQEGEKER